MNLDSNDSGAWPAAGVNQFKTIIVNYSLSMVLIDEIREKIEAGQFELSKHAVDQSIIRRISVKETQELFGDAEVIEDYPEDKYGVKLFDLGKD